MPNDDSQLKPGSGASAVTNCPNCGASISAESKFCSNCGSRTQQFPVFTEADTLPGAPVGDTPPPAPPASESEEPPLVATAERRGQDPTATSPTAQRLRKELQGRYEIVRELGRGGMATVFLAKDSKHGRNVAIKVLHPELSASIGGDRFEREIRVVAAMQHPNILGLYDSGSADGLLYYVMPFVDGESLRDRIDREGQLGVDEAIRITLEVANALGYAHGKGIVHRDIKPENILLSGELTLVADFGIARAASEASTQKLTQTGMAIGTPLYMAPEQAGGEAVGPSADIYSLGCMLYEMLAGEPPFTGKNPIAIMARHAMEQVPSIRIVRSSVPAEVEEAIFAAMGKVPADRPQTAAQFAELMGMPLGSTTTMRVRGRTTAYPVVAPTTGRRRLVIGGVAAAVLVAAGIGGYFLATGGNAGDPGAPGLPPNRIAVLYFADESRGGELAHLADGLTEALIRELDQVRALDVISANGVEPFRGTTAPADSVARVLGAGTLIRGSVEQVGDRVRVVVRLLDGETGADFGERAAIEQPAADPLALRDTLAQSVARLIRTRVGDEVNLRTQRAGTRNAAAWTLLQRGEKARRDAERLANEEDHSGMATQFDLADSLLAAAERLDASWPDPIVARAFTGYRRAAYSDEPADTPRWSDLGLAHANRALRLDPRNAAALEAKGTILYWQVLNRLVDPSLAITVMDSAKVALEAATQIEPGRAQAWSVLCRLYDRLDLPVEANFAARKAYEEDAYLQAAPVILTLLAFTSYDLEQFQDADRWCRLGAARFPQEQAFVRCQISLLSTPARTADIDEAWRLVDELRKVVPEQDWDYTRREAQIFVAAVIAKAGLPDSARAVLLRSRADPSLDPTRRLVSLEAAVRLMFGDQDEAMRLLTEYVTAVPESREGFARQTHWWWRGLRENPRFRRLVGLAG